MEDSTRILEFVESTECIIAQESTGRSYNRRSSILKPQKPRNPLQDLDFNPTLVDETTVTQKSRRVSFAAGLQVKEFHEVRTEVANVTVWGPSYEQAILNSGSDSSHQTEFTTQGDCSNITNFGALVTGRIQFADCIRRDDSENTPIDLHLQRNYNNAKSNGAVFDERPLDLTVGTARSASSKRPLQVSNQKCVEDSRCEEQIISGSTFQSEYSHHSIKTTFYGGDDEMDMSFSMRDENKDGLFDKTAYVDAQDLSSSSEMFGTSGTEVGGRLTRPQINHLNRTVLDSNMDFTELPDGKIFLQPGCKKALDTYEHQIGSSSPFCSPVAYESSVHKKKTVFASNMDFTEPVDVHMLFPLQSNYQAEADKTQFVENMELTEAVSGNTASPYGEVDDNMDCSCHSNDLILDQSWDKRHDRTTFCNDMDMTKHVQSSLPQSREYNLDRTAYVREKEITRLVNAAEIEQHKHFGQINRTAHADEVEKTKPANAAVVNFQSTQLNRTAYLDDMDITKPVDAEIINRQATQLNRTAFLNDMDITKPVEAPIINHQATQLNRTAFLDDMDVTKPVDAAIINHQATQLNQTAFLKDMDITKPVEAPIINHQGIQLNRRAFLDDMDVTKPVDAAIINHQATQLNRIAFLDNMDVTKPIAAPIINHQATQLNRTAFLDDMDVTKHVDAAIINRQATQPNRTAFLDDMDVTKPVDAAIINCQPTQLNRTAFLDDMDITKPVDAAIINRQATQPNRTAFLDDMDVTKPVDAAIINRQATQLNRTAFLDDMDVTKPVDTAIINRQATQLNRTAYLDDMDVTKPVDAAIINRQATQPNRTAFLDDMDVTKPVDAAIINRQATQLNQTAFLDDMDVTKPVDAAIINRQATQLNRTAYLDDMDITKPVDVSKVEQPIVDSPLTKNDGETLNISPYVSFGDISITKNICDESKIETRLQEHKESCNNVDDSKSERVGAIRSSENSLPFSDFHEQVSIMDELPPNNWHLINDRDTSSSSLQKIISNQSAVTEKCSGEFEMATLCTDKTTRAETIDFSLAINETIAILKPFNSADKYQDSAEVPEQGILQSNLQSKSIVQHTLLKNELAMDASESSLQSGDLYLGSDQMNKSSTLNITSSRTNTAVLSEQLQNLLTELNEFPAPENSRKSTFDTKVNMPETVSPKHSSEKCVKSLVAGFADCTTQQEIVDLSFAGEVERSHFNNGVKLSELKRPWKSETSIVNADICSPPKQICLQTNDREVLVTESKCNFEKFETTDACISKISVLLLQPEEMDDSFRDNEALIRSSEHNNIEEISVSSFQEIESNSHLDLTTDVVQKCDTGEMEPMFAPRLEEPETVEEVIRKLEKRSKEWVILELEELAWSFSFFCKSLDLVLQLGPACEDGGQEVVSIHFVSHCSKKSKALCTFSHKWLINAFPVKKMQLKCKSVSDAEDLLNSISNESAKIKLFVDDFVVMENLYGMKMKIDPLRASVLVTSYPLFSSFTLTINLESTWKTFVPEDITVVHLVGKTIQTEVIKSFAKGVAAGPNCLKIFFLYVKKYINDLEKFRPQGPLRLN